MTCWIVEKRNPTRFLKCGPGGFDWTDDAYEALRLARRVDGEMILPAVADAEIVVEHMWEEEIAPRD